MDEKNYVVATIKPWNIEQFYSYSKKLSGNWHLITEPGQLKLDRLEQIKPRYLFFPHWSHKVPKTIYERYECVCFHETDLPFGRGGSPLQNLISRGYCETMITALKMTEELDAGPVYFKKPLSLYGLAEEIFLRASRIVQDMIFSIAENEPTPTIQFGEVTVFDRRTPEQSLISGKIEDIEKLFDHIRMLDAEGYPKAFIEYGNFKIIFTRPALRTGRIEATVNITKRKDSSND